MSKIGDNNSVILPRGEGFSVDRPQYQQIAAWFEATRRDLKRPEKLPAEVALAEKYSVARETIRRSMKLLELSGAVTRRRGRGTYLRPLSSASPLMPGESIGFIPPWWATSLSAWYTATVFDGVSEWTDRRELQQSVLRVDRFGDDAHVLLERIRTRRLKGLVWVHPVPEQVEILMAAAQHVPCVVIGRDYAESSLHTVLPDYQQAALQIDAHLAANNHLEYALMSRTLEDPLAVTWLGGIKQAHIARGTRFDVSQRYLDVGTFDRSRLAELISEFYLRRHPSVKALVATSSSYLVPLFSDNAFRARIPKEISVVAFDYGVQPMHTYWPGVTVTHVKCDWTAIGRKAMDVLCSLADGEHVPRVQYQQVEFVEGQTVSKKH